MGFDRETLEKLLKHVCPRVLIDMSRLNRYELNALYKLMDKDEVIQQMLEEIEDTLPVFDALDKVKSLNLKITERFSRLIMDKNDDIDMTIAYRDKEYLQAFLDKDELSEFELKRHEKLLKEHNELINIYENQRDYFEASLKEAGDEYKTIRQLIEEYQTQNNIQVFNALLYKAIKSHFAEARESVKDLTQDADKKGNTLGRM